MLRFDPFRDLERLSDQLANAAAGTARSPRFMPMDLYKVEDHYVLHADLPGVDAGSIDLNVENNVLTLKAERTPRSDEGLQWIGAERPTGTYMRQLTLGEGIDAERITADYRDGVLSVTIPVAEKAKPRRIEIQHDQEKQAIDA